MAWKRKPRIGFKYDFLTTIEFIGVEKTHSVYICECVCGNTTTAKYIGKKLSKKSCGCRKYFRRFKRQKTQEKELNIYSTIYNRYRREAVERGYKFDLNYKLFVTLVQRNCFYCETPPSNKQQYNNRLEVLYNGIDRVDNSVGYLETNCVPCCSVCNSHKKSVTPTIIQKAYEFLWKKQIN
jgi:hypothetical protein